MSKSKLQIRCDRAANEVLFGKGTTVTDLMERFGLGLRKGKTKGQVIDAVQKGRREGNARTETELSMISLRLSQVFKVQGEPK